MGHVQRQDAVNRDLQAKDAGEEPKKKEPVSRQRMIEEKARRLIAGERYEEALNLLKSCGPHDTLLLNARGIALMRLGRAEDAIKVYRSFVLQPGSVWTRKDVPVEFTINYATALLMANLVEGCVETLGELNREDHPSVVRLRQAIRRWKSEFTFLQKLSWWTGVSPNRPVTLDFVPGEFLGGADSTEEGGNSPERPAA